MNINQLHKKIKKRIWYKIVHTARNSVLYPFLYKSYWFSLFVSEKKIENTTCYFTARPNPGAGIGHQMANWIAGLWFARQFNLEFAHIPFSAPAWETLLGFGENEVKVVDLLRKGYKIQRIPLFNENNLKEVQWIKRIVQAYSGKKIILLCEQDQFYRDQYGVMGELQQKFYAAPVRKQDQLIYSKDHFNIVIHVRRGDIMTDPDHPNLQIRFISNKYFENVLKQMLNKLQTEKPVYIYFFSQGKPEDYPEFNQFENLHWCLDMGAQDSFLHFVYADLLITSKSSFSYKPALLNKGLKVCPEKFWHGYPTSENWILADNDGNILSEKIIK